MNRNLKKTYPYFMRFLGLNEIGTTSQKRKAKDQFNKELMFIEYNASHDDLGILKF